jgi:hypothetical protein
MHMAETTEPKRFVVNTDLLPPNFPTHKHPKGFWEMLGRAIATFGFLEEALGKAIFVFTGTRPIQDDEFEAELQKWLPTLKRALSDPLGGLIDSYGNAVRANSSATITNLDDLLEDLRKVAVIRNVLCHGSWREPDAQERSLPLFVNRQGEIFQTPIDIAFLQQMQLQTAELSCAVINSVTHMGYQFPGSGGPGTPLWR